MTENNENLPALQIKSQSAFSGIQAFEDAQRMAKALCSSSMVPEQYRGPNGQANALIALEMAQRVGASPMAVMQNLHIIQGRPSWSSSFIIASLNSCGRFSPIRFEKGDLGTKQVTVETWVGPKGQRRKASERIEIENKTCRAWATDNTGARLEGPMVTMEMAALEGWLTKNDSKWQTMPELMLQYRSAAFFGRLYAPDILMGMHSEDESRDMPANVIDVTPTLVVEPDALKPVTVEIKTEGIDLRSMEDEIIDGINDAGSNEKPEGNAIDRDGIKKELDRLEVEYSSRAKTATLEKLLHKAVDNEAQRLHTSTDEPPPLSEAPAEEEPAEQQTDPGATKPAPKDLF